MRFRDLDSAQRAHEHYHDLAVPPGAWIIVRVDGRAFTTLTASRYQKPYDLRFAEIMAMTGAALLTEFDALYAYTQSDEISLLLPRDTEAFGRSVEKLVSLSAATASATFTHVAGHVGCFDARLWVGAGVGDVVDYFAWRQADAARNAMNAWSYWSLREQGLTGAQATRRLAGLDRAAKNEVLSTYGVSFNDRPAWQRRGIGLWSEAYQKSAYNPKEQRKVVATRRRVHYEYALPMGAPYRELVEQLAGGAVVPGTDSARGDGAS